MSFDRMGTYDIEVLFDDQDGSTLGYDAMMERALKEQQEDNKRSVAATMLGSVRGRVYPPDIVKAKTGLNDAKAQVRKHKKASNKKMIKRWEDNVKNRKIVLDGLIANWQKSGNK